MYLFAKLNFILNSTYLQLCEEVQVKRSFGQRGGPWEFNLRDLFRWCDLMMHDQGQGKGHWDPSQHVGLIYSERLRLQEDKELLLSLFEMVFEGKVAAYRCSREVFVTPLLVQVNE